MIGEAIRFPDKARGLSRSMVMTDYKEALRGLSAGEYGATMEWHDDQPDVVVVSIQVNPGFSWPAYDLVNPVFSATRLEAEQLEASGASWITDRPS
jgi:hypothetical protein